MVVDAVQLEVEYAAVTKPAHPATLHSYLLDKQLFDSVWKKRPAVIVCPGGGYTFTSDREWEPIALEFCAKGYHSFALDYSVAPTGFPVALCELSKAVAYVRSIAEQYGIDDQKIIVCGFSAGGHLAASLGVYWNADFVKSGSGIVGDENKPNGVILGYPVITSKKGLCHQGTVDAFLSGNTSKECFDLFALEEHVTAQTAPTFIWHTLEDDAVPVENAMLFASALRKSGVSFELHIYPHGGHGLSLANDLTANFPAQNVLACQNWVEMAIRWIREL